MKGRGTKSSNLLQKGICMYSIKLNTSNTKNARMDNLCDSTFGVFKKSTNDAAQVVELVVF